MKNSTYDPAQEGIDASRHQVAQAIAEEKLEETLDNIAREILDLDTLETRKSDELDFHDLAVWQIERALRAAFEAGRKEAS